MAHPAVETVCPINGHHLVLDTILAMPPPYRFRCGACGRMHEWLRAENRVVDVEERPPPESGNTD
jgi:hypothetical protein